MAAASRTCWRCNPASSGDLPHLRHVQDVGASAFSPSGDLNPGTISINGQREFANSFVLNGSDVEEDVNMGAAIVPNLDSIAEFRILTSNFDAEIWRVQRRPDQRGHQIRDECVSRRCVRIPAQHGPGCPQLFFAHPRRIRPEPVRGNLGGPIRKNKVFFFADYQGTRLTQGIDTGEIPVPSSQDRAGNLSDVASSFTTVDQNGIRSRPR